MREALTGFTGVRLVEVDGESLYLAGSPIETTGWSVISAVRAESADQPARMLEARYEGILGEAQSAYTKGLSSSRNMILILLLIVFLLALTAALILAKRIVKPLN